MSKVYQLKHEQHSYWTAQVICSLLLVGMRLRLGQRGDTQKLDNTADLLLPSFGALFTEKIMLAVCIK